MNRSWYSGITIISLFCQIVLPKLPFPADLHEAIDVLPAFFGAVIGVMGWQAYDLHKDGSKLPEKQSSQSAAAGE